MIPVLKTKMMLLFYLLNVPLRDGGQAYTETNLDRLVVEPWNFVTVFFFVACFRSRCRAPDAAVFVPNPAGRNPLESFIFAVHKRKPICH
jgi:hypothetical protein